MTRRFTIAYDYLCPFARNANEHIIAASAAGADWDVTFQPHSLSQGHVHAGEPAVWDRDEPNLVSGVLALQVGLAVRDRHPDAFADVHVGLFAARHDHGRDIKDPAVVWRVLETAGLDPESVFAELATGRPLAVLRREHTAGVEHHGVFGVPTFIAGDRAVFVRLLDRPEGDGAVARHRIEQVLDLVEGAPALHEFKQTDLPR